MTAMIIKRRARKPIAVARVKGMAVYPGGVGGMGTKDPCYSFDVGDYRVHLTAVELFDLLASFRGLTASTALAHDAGLIY